MTFTEEISKSILSWMANDPTKGEATHYSGDTGQWLKLQDGRWFKWEHSQWKVLQVTDSRGLAINADLVRKPKNGEPNPAPMWPPKPAQVPVGEPPSPPPMMPGEFREAQGALQYPKEINVGSVYLEQDANHNKTLVYVCGIDPVRDTPLVLSAHAESPRSANEKQLFSMPSKANTGIQAIAARLIKKEIKHPMYEAMVIWVKCMGDQAC